MDLPKNLISGRNIRTRRSRDHAIMRDVIARLKKNMDRDLNAVALTVIRLFQEEPGDAEHLWKRCQPLVG